MEFSNQQKLIITLLTDVHEALGITNSVDPSFVQRMVNSNNGWALSWAYPGLFEEAGETPDQVQFVADVLDMWEAIELAYSNLAAADVTALEQAAPTFGRTPAFPGFDGNNEAELRSIVSILVDDLGRWSTFKGRNTNSHAGTADGYRRMLPVYNDVANGGYGFTPTVDQLAAILNERVHPSNR
ncbi:YfbU family protein [Pseudomonas tohonis]|uniref:YfbU family protein n=1 Tax=Pseudomonas tohonis TaxID=2725477 RepID=UPI001F42A4D9|nr:YfbU family protein [Pseudomonas tohonis]